MYRIVVLYTVCKCYNVEIWRIVSLELSSDMCKSRHIYYCLTFSGGKQHVALPYASIISIAWPLIITYKLWVPFFSLLNHRVDMITDLCEYCWLTFSQIMHAIHVHSSSTNNILITQPSRSNFFYICPLLLRSGNNLRYSATSNQWQRTRNVATSNQCHGTCNDGTNN